MLTGEGTVRYQFSENSLKLVYGLVHAEVFKILMMFYLLIYQLIYNKLGDF